MQDHCHSASHVRAAAQAARKWREKMFSPAPPKPPEPELEPEPAPQEVLEIPAFLPARPAIPGPNDFNIARPSVQEIIRRMARIAGFTVTDLCSARRTFPLVRPRQIAMALAKELTQRTLPDIGRKFGGRDHTTILHAVRRYAPLMDATRVAMQPHASLDDWINTALELSQTIPLANYRRGAHRDGGK
jgi:hypothetical protein